jgi:SAM-dependent methyltransferase
MVATATNAGEQACPVCGAAGLRAVQDHDRYTLMHCASCGVQHWHPLVHPGAEFYEDERDGIYKELHEGKDRDDDPRFVRFFREHGGLRDVRALDIGCSDGAFLARLQAQGNRVWGIDIDSRALEVARRRGLEQVERAEVPQFVEKARRQGLVFDLITAFDVIEHLTDPVAAIRDLASILAPGGRFVGTVPNRRRLFANAMPIDFPPHHFYRFDATSMREALARAGLDAERVDAFQYNYTMSTLLAETMRAARRRRGGGSAASAPSTPAQAPSKPSRATQLKHAIARAWHVLGTPVSYVLERPQQRGFKLWFEARKR